MVIRKGKAPESDSRENSPVPVIRSPPPPARITKNKAPESDSRENSPVHEIRSRPAILTKGVESDSRENSPDRDDGTETRTSKKRKVLSCYACRNRKMKCDRVYPVCGRCQKTGRADQCSYDPRLLEEAHVQSGQSLTASVNNTVFTMHGIGSNGDYANDETSEALRWKLRMQERRIEMLEKQLTAASSSSDPLHLKIVPTKESTFAEEMMFRGKGFKTQFHGTTSVMSIISQVMALPRFLRSRFVAN